MSTVATEEFKYRKHAGHFTDAPAHHEACKFGTWLFLLTEVLTFGGVFVLFAIFSSQYPVIFEEGAKLLNWKLGAVNTVVLLFSSFTVVKAISAAKSNNSAAIVKYLAASLACGFVFLGVKYYEYTHKFHEGIFPGKFFAYDHAAVDNMGFYFSFYFTMTGIHALHEIIGMILIAMCLFKAKNGRYHKEYYTSLESVGLFWHLIDLVWIYLFPLLYLI